MAVEITSLTGYAASTFLANNSGATALECVAGTGTGNVVRATSPTLVTPAIGTPSSGTLTSCTGLPISTGVSGLGSGVATLLATFSSANLAAALTDETGSGANVFGTSPTLATPVINVGSDATGDIYYRNSGGAFTRLAIGTTGQVLNVGGSGVPAWATSSGGGNAQTANPLSQFASTTSSQLAGVMSDETGSGALVFATSPTLVTPILGTPTSGTLTNCTGLPHASIVGDKVEFQLALSDLSTALTIGTTKGYFHAPCAFTLTGVHISVNTAPTGSTLIVDVNKGSGAGTSMLSTKVSVDASEFSSDTAASAAVISTSAVAQFDRLSFDIDQVGSTIAGAGLIVTLIGTRS